MKAQSTITVLSVSYAVCLSAFYCSAVPTNTEHFKFYPTLVCALFIVVISNCIPMYTVENTCTIIVCCCFFFFAKAAEDNSIAMT